MERERGEWLAGCVCVGGRAEKVNSRLMSWSPNTGTKFLVMLGMSGVGKAASACSTSRRDRRS